MTGSLFRNEDERQIYDNVVHNLRRSGWSKSDAEGEALDRLERLRAKERGNG